jgi:accessory Sec system glycosyltransferase GtfB
VERYIEPDVILLFDTYSRESRMLHESFKMAGCGYPAVVLGEDTFLPDDVMSVYSLFLDGQGGEGAGRTRPLYFNEVRVPDYWGIDDTGRIHCLQEKKGRIIYAEPVEKRFVKDVEWFDGNGVVRLSEHYNSKGKICARTSYDAKGKKINRAWFSEKGQEMIVENHVTGDIVLNGNDGETDGQKVFQSKKEFALYFMEKTGFSKNRIFFNTLSMSFFVSQKLEASGKKDVLFWQEPIGNEIPGNMQIILKGQANRATDIIVQKRDSFDKLLALGARQDMLHRLGFIYPFRKENKNRPEVLICTNSDMIEHCDKMISSFPQMNFHIAALTMMSSRLMGMEAYDNVNLYPAINMSVLENLFEICDFYLDINHGSEVVSAVSKAFLYNQLIFAFEETVHAKEYVTSEHIYASDNVEAMIREIEKITGNMDLLQMHLKKQHMYAMAESTETYQDIL